MFTRSYSTEDADFEPHLNVLIDGGQVTVKAAANNAPNRLGLRIAEGEDVMAIWFDWENQAELESVSERAGFTIPSTAGITGRNHLLPIEQMDKAEILGFCRSMNVHPAHLMPLKSNPEFSLPTPLLEVLIDMSHGKGASNAADIDLARAGIQFEIKRINRFLSERPAETNEGTALTLVQVFSSVLNNPVLMGKLARESRGINESSKENAYIHYPLATRVRNIALVGLQDQAKALRKQQAAKENSLNSALDGIKTDYSLIFNSNTAQHQLLLFIGDVKDGLWALNIEPREATIGNIFQVIQDLDFTGSRMQKAYHYFNNRYGESEPMLESGQEFLTELAEDMAVYFASEDRLSKAQRRTAQEIDKLPLREDIEKVFEAENFKDGTLFRRLMDHSVMIALAFHERHSEPTIAPK